MLPNQPKKERVSNPTPYPSAHMMTAAIIFWRVDDGVGGRCRGCAGVTPTGGGPATCMSPQTGAGQRLGLRRRRVCLSLMAGMRRAPGIAEEGERARPSGTRPPRAIGAPGVVKVVGGGWAGRQPAPWEAGPSFVRRRWTIPPSPATHVLRSGLSRSQEVTRTELVEAATIRDAIFRSTKAPPRTPLGMSVRNWCHFTVPPRPRTRPPIQQGAPSGYSLASLSVGVGRPTCRTRDPAGVEVCAC